MPFQDRIDAGRQLADRLGEYRPDSTMVVGLAWGGVVVARAIADALVAPMDVLVAHHLHAPNAEGTAFGAVAAFGEPVLDEAAMRALMLPPGYMAALVHHQRGLAEQQERLLRGLDRRRVEGKTVIVVDQGVCTGLSMRAALRDLRRRRPEAIVVAVPVAAAPALAALRAEADHVVAIEAPEAIATLAHHYAQLPPLTTEDVRGLVVHQVG